MSKLYSDYLDEISPDKLFAGLLGFGLFSEKLPPIFSSKEFLDFCSTQNNLPFDKKPKDYIRYFSMRNTNIPRELAIPSPFPYAHLCRYLENNWTEIKQFLKKKTANQNYKVSQIHIQKLKTKNSLFEMSHEYYDKDPSIELKLASLAIGKCYVVHADISSCFPSIYSHSLAWALVGKEKAKQNKGKKNEWFNVLDFLSRNIKNGETNGLLIGPHSSNLLSEIILCCVDNQLVNKGYSYYRHIDDFTCFVNTEDEADKFILDLSTELRNYELSLNAKKTKIIKLPAPIEADWVNSLNSFFIGDEFPEDKKTFFLYKRLKTFLNLVVQLANNSGNYAVYTYAIKIISKYKLGWKARAYYLNFIHQSLCLYPYIIHTVDEYVFQPFCVSPQQIQQITQDLYEVGVKKRIYEACSFCLYLSLKYNFILDFDIADSLHSEDCIYMLLGYIVAKKSDNQIALHLYKEEARRLLKEDLNRYWLFIYEVLSTNELTNTDFKCIKAAKISFIRTEFQFPTQQHP